ncbi:MAG: DUF4404 family protein [Actinomycetota bacterium]
MNQKDMAELIAELREALAASDGLADDERAELEALADKIEAEADESVLESMDDAVTRFEVEHSGLVRAIGRIADALSAGGI